MLEKVSSKKNILLYGSLIFLFCYFFQLFGFLNRYALLCSGILFLLYVFAEKRLYLNIREILLAVGLFLYAWIAGFSLSDIVSTTALPVLLLLIAKYMLFSSDSQASKNVWRLLTVFVLGFTLHGLLNSILYFHSGFTENMGRMWKDIWTGIDLPATHQNVYVIPALALMFPALLYVKKHAAVCLSMLVIDLFFLIHSICSLSRIPVLLWAIMFVWEVALFLFLNRKSGQLGKYLKTLGLVFIACALLAAFLCIQFNLLENQRLLSALNRNNGILHNIRFQAQLNAIRQLFVYPFGGYQMDLCGMEHCHNVWLDIANASGLIPFSIIVVYTILTFVDAINLLRNPEIDVKLKYIISGLYFSFTIYYMVEPALMANINFFVPWTYINGIIFGYTSITKRKKSI